MRPVDIEHLYWRTHTLVPRMLGETEFPFVVTRYVFFIRVDIFSLAELQWLTTDSNMTDLTQLA